MPPANVGRGSVINGGTELHTTAASKDKASNASDSLSTLHSLGIEAGAVGFLPEKGHVIEA